MELQKTQNRPQRPSFIKLVISTLAAAFGVQTRKNLEDDSTQRSALPFIVAGVLFTVAFVLSLVLIVRLVLTSLT